MKWRKEGKICDCYEIGLDWCKTNIMTPVPLKKDKKTIRIYVAFCDDDNCGRIGYLDVNAENPLEVVGYSQSPVLDIGKTGRFDDNGVLPSCIFRKDEKLYLLYSGYQRFKSYPYTSFTGLAVSYDDGDYFERVQEVPILDRVEDELYIRASGTILEFGDFYRIYYASGSEWISRTNNKDVPKYEIRYVDVKNFATNKKNFIGGGGTCVPLRGGEIGITTPQVWHGNNIYRMIYSYRKVENGYQMGYAESLDGSVWMRKDNFMDISLSSGGWDSEMICYGKMMSYGEKTYLFYCGNHYGRDGIGYAVLDKNS